MKLRNTLLLGLLALSTSQAATIIGIDPDPVARAGDDDANKAYIYIITSTKLPNGAEVTGWLVNNKTDTDGDGGAAGTTPVTPLIFEATGGSPTYTVTAVGAASANDALTEASAHSFSYTVPATGDYFAGFHQTFAVLGDSAVGFTTGSTIDHFFRTDAGVAGAVPGIGDSGVIGGAGSEFSSNYNGGESLTALISNPRDYDFGVVVEPVPEPSSALLGLLGLGLLARRRR